MNASHPWFARLFACLCLLAGLAAASPALAGDAEVQITWRLLDYVAVDYAGAVADGRVISQSEYAEMTEFAASAEKRLGALPTGQARNRLLGDAKALRAAIAAKAAPADVGRLARGLASALIAAFPVPLAPPKAPDPARGAALYAENCAACHGSAGDAKGPLSAALDPPPIAFADRERARERSLFALYQVIEQGLDGTAMASFAHLPAEDKWALAFHAGRFAFPPAMAEQGKRIWESDAALRGRISSLAALTSLTPAALAREIGLERAEAVTAYLRANPAAVTAVQGPHVLDLARERLQQSLAVYQAGNHKQAEELALSAYLDGFEPVEPMLSARDADLMRRIEGAMAGVRAAIGGGRPAETVREQIGILDGLFAEAEAALLPSRASPSSTFVGAFTILLREGLEALLIVVAMLAFLRKADRPSMVRTVHYGWIAALGAGVATWWAATHLITVSGASRELTEGFGSLLAAAVLVFVGIWMHGKSQADEWQRYIREKVGQALTRSSAWFLFGLAFIAVYREVFETILFYAALSADGNGLALLGGALAGILGLAAVAVAMMRFSRKLPIGKFFAYSSALIAILTVVLAGKGVAALQEAGMVAVHPVAHVPTVSMLGIFPTAEALAAQAAALLILIAGFLYNRRALPREAMV
jgi:high-affinity iron transporter